jgi:hypothetical protein
MTKKERELKEAKVRIDRMGRVNNVLMEIINKSQLPLSEILMVLELIKDEVVQGFKYEVSAEAIDGSNVG